MSRNNISRSLRLRYKLLAIASLTLLTLGRAEAQHKAAEQLGYAVFLINVTDPGIYKSYVASVLPTLAAYGGKVISAVGKDDMRQVEGTASFDRGAILQFPSLEIAERWYNSDAYKASIALRNRSGQAQVILLRGRQQ